MAIADMNLVAGGPGRTVATTALIGMRRAAAAAHMAIAVVLLVLPALSGSTGD